jgi:hypothetical protein
MLRALFLSLVLSTTVLGAVSTSPAAPWLGEQSQTWTTDDGSVRISLNTPDDVDPAKSTQLIVYALPNGNTIEQTLGCKLASGMDWHFDIQHIAAQTRKLRQLDTSRNIILACVEAHSEGKFLSWPLWRKERKDNGHQIRLLVNEIARKCRLAPSTIALAGHSGGGSFLFGFINGAADIADNVSRIAFLDANYAYTDEEHHGEKLQRWLKDDPGHQLIVIAYDDRNIQLNGKPVLKNPLGGTYGSTKRMIEFFHPAAGSAVPLFEHYTGPDNQSDFLIHTNPENKILHTRLVELNGFLYAMTFNTALANKWGTFFTERVYTDLIAPAPATQPSTRRASTTIPSRPKGALAGHAFMKQIEKLPLIEREAAIQKEVLSGNVPDRLRQFVDVDVTAQGLDGRAHAGTFRAAFDYLAIGSNEDFVRIPMTPASATVICRAFNYSLPTRKMVDAIYKNAFDKLEPKPLTENRESVMTFVQHNQIIEDQLRRQGNQVDVAGIKKDVVITPALKVKPNKVAIYGWHKLDGKPIQPLYTGHADFYVDYSHGIRLIAGTMMVDNVERTVSEVLKDPELSTLLSDEGPVDFSYPLVVRPPPK